MIHVRLAFEDGRRVAYTLDQDGAPTRTLEFSCPDLPLGACGDAALVASLPLAMAAREPLRIELPVSRRLRDAIPSLLDIHAVWWRADDVHIGVETGAGALPTRGRAHGGAYRQDLASVNLDQNVDGPDILFAASDDTVVPARARTDRHGRPVPVVTTNLRATAEAFGLRWEEQYRGPALAAVGHSLTDLGRLDLPAPFSVHYLFPWGSHALTDPLWSGDGLDVRHRHADIDWIDQLRFLVSVDDADRLDVCDHGSDRGCGRCQPCLFLDAGRAVVADDRVIDHDAIAALDLAHHAVLADTAVLLRQARASGRTALVEALETAVRRLDPDDVVWPDNWFAYLSELGSARR